MGSARSGYSISEHEKGCLQCCGFRTFKLAVPSVNVFPKTCSNMGTSV